MRINRSVVRALDILNLIADRRDLLTITEVSKALDLPKTSVFELVYALVDRGYLEIADQKLKTFRLGMKSFQTGIAYLEKADLCHETHPFLEEMMNATGETVFLVTESNGKVVYLDKVESTASIRTSSTLGSTNPMHCTGVGKALLAAYSNERIKEITDLHGLSAKTAYSITEYEILLADLDLTRERGYSIDNRESELEVFCVAAPVYDSQAIPIAAISIASLASRVLSDPNRVPQLGQLVSSSALTISKRLGFRKDTLFPLL